MKLRFLSLVLIACFLAAAGAGGQSSQALIEELQREIEALRLENRQLKAQVARDVNPRISPEQAERIDPDGSPLRPASTAGLNAERAPSTPPKLQAGALYDASGKLLKSYADCVVIIEGDNSVGTGFLVKSGTQLYIYTAAHVISGNNKLTIKNSSGFKYSKFGQMETAVGGDLARIELREAAAGLEIGRGEKAVQINLEIAALGNGGGAGVMAVEHGKILGISGDTIEIDAAIIQGNSGGPVVDVLNGQVLGVATHLTAAKKDIWSEGTRQGDVRRFACRLDKDWTWKPVAIGKFLAEGRLVEDYDNVTKLCYALTMLEPGASGMRLDHEVGGNRSAAQILDENKNIPIVQELYAMNRELVSKKIAASEVDLKRRFRSVISRAMTLAGADKAALVPTEMSWFHARNAEESLKFRRAAIERLNERLGELK